MQALGHRLAIIGAGNVGASIAYAAMLQRITSEILLVDIDQPRCEAQVLDISDGAFTSDTRIRVGTFQEAGQCGIIAITAGAKQKQGETRVELMGRNYAILKSCIESMKPFNSSAILLLVANPVDVLTYYAQKLSGLPRNQVIGSGTFLDSSRLRAILADHLKVAETAVHAYVLGEHGDSQFVGWSSAHVANTPLLSMPAFKSLDPKKISEDVKRKAYKIIDVKGATNYGIGACAASICESIFFNTRKIRPVSHFNAELGVCLSLPAVLGANGVEQTLKPPLSDEEDALLKKSAEALKDIISKNDTE